MSVLGTVLWGTVRRGNVFRELSVGEETVGEIPLWEMCIGKLSRYWRNNVKYSITAFRIP